MVATTFLGQTWGSEAECFNRLTGVLRKVVTIQALLSVQKD